MTDRPAPEAKNAPGMKWTKDGRYFGRDEQVEAYDRGENVTWENDYGESETVDLTRPSPEPSGAQE